MYVFIIANFLVIPLLVLAHPNGGDIVDHTSARASAAERAPPRCC